jgi:chemotaxis protein MotB
MMDTPSSIFKKKHTEENTEAWLMSYADMITLLLCFFIIFVSTSEPKEDKLAAATRGMKARFGMVDLSTPFDGALRVVQGVIEENKAFKALAVQKTERGLIIELSADAFFIDNTAEFVPEKMPMLEDVVDSFKDAGFQSYDVVIEGHTDDRPMSENTTFPTPWEFSAARAARMARLFEARGIDTKRLQVAAFGGVHPKVPNATSTGEVIPQNRERNRRIVISLERKL